VHLKERTHPCLTKSQRAEGQLEARLRAREEHVKRGRALEQRRDAVAMVTIYDPTAGPSLAAILGALAAHAREMADLDAEIAAWRKRLAAARAGEREREAARLRACDLGAEADRAHLAKVNSAPPAKPTSQPWLGPQDGCPPWLKKTPPKDVA
jgi:hypothetical protein